MKIRVYEYEGCSTCRKALKFLDARDVAYERVPIVATPPTLSELKAMLAFVGDRRRLFNVSGVLYRELKVAEKLKTLSDAQALALLAAHGKLVKRPFVLLADLGLLGFNETEWQAAFARRRA
ncbi:MAG: Spx/MgsR family RNA polymerase-binding regulatory protein [Elusimicrobia bacterium]|nr:Spx/MgsR family RNA polymerase-binding regulatory protein [Elusimicrobiota bacterium]